MIINDRGPFHPRVTLNLARGAAHAIGMTRTQWVCMNRARPPTAACDRPFALPYVRSRSGSVRPVSVFLIECRAQPPASSKLDRCPQRGAQLDNSSNEVAGFRLSGIRTAMKYISELRSAAAQPPPNAKVLTTAISRRPQPARKNAPSRFPRLQARNTQNAQRNYERYLAMARTEALAGDRIVAENYFQHAEHYFRSMGENPN